MKPYPFQEFEVLEGFYTGRKLKMPTSQALQNFEHYLDENEWVFYWALPEVTRLQIALSTNPFNAFKDIYENSVS